MGPAVYGTVITVNLRPCISWTGCLRYCTLFHCPMQYIILNLRPCISLVRLYTVLYSLSLSYKPIYNIKSTVLYIIGPAVYGTVIYNSKSMALYILELIVYGTIHIIYNNKSTALYIMGPAVYGTVQL